MPFTSVTVSGVPAMLSRHRLRSSAGSALARPVLASVLALGLATGTAPARPADAVSPGQAVGSAPTSAASQQLAAHGRHHHGVGIGDRYFPTAGNPGYDVRHYAIAVRYLPGNDKVVGNTAVRLRSTKRLPTLNLDLLLRATAVEIGGRPTPFRQTRHELTVRPHRTLARHSIVVVRVHYAGRPAGLRYGGASSFEPTRTGAIAVGEPASAAWWFPSNDHPSDKATYDVALTVPRGFQAVSNGRLVSHRSGRRPAVWRWSEPVPMATYLAFAAFGHYDLLRGRTPTGLRYVYAFERGLGHQSRPARRSLRQTPEIVRWLSGRWGAYPFGDIGGVVPNARLGYALENQTRPVYGRDMFRFGADRSLVVHELAHQWFGDRVSVSRWRNIWLNEGFATYSQWLWEHHLGGRSPERRLLRVYRLFEPSSSFWSLEIGDPGPARMFDDAVYDRGAMAVQALRVRLGGPTFFRVVHRWIHHNRDGNGSIRELRRVAERMSGEDLRGFFRHWLYSTTKPAPTAENGLGGA
jgi:aminopeptidase N